MRKVLAILIIIALVPLMASCKPFCAAVKDTGRGIGSIGEGVARGTMEAGKGAGALVGGTVEAATEILTGKGGDQALETQKQAFERTGEGVKGAVEETLGGIGKSAQPLSDAMK